jgi:curved DNA-binding protein
MTDYYKILNVAENATQEQIRKAFRQLAFQFHPDMVGEDSFATERFIEIREAYEVLHRQQRRQQYDRDRRENRTSKEHFPKPPPAAQRTQHRSSPPPPAESTRTTYPRGTFTAVHLKYATSRPPMAAEDISGSLELSIEDTLHTTLQSVLLEHYNAQRVMIQVPPCLYPGSWIKIASLGALKRNGTRGDLYLEIQTAKHPLLRLCGGTLFYDLTLLPWQAALGIQTQIPTPDGPRKMTISAVLGQNNMKRVEGAGLYRPNGTRGDLWINVKLEIPPPATFRARRLWAELAEEYKHSTRPQ